MNTKNNIVPGTRVVVYDAWANGSDAYYKNQGKFVEATVIRRYGIRSEYNKNWIYPDLIDVQFDELGLRPESLGLFSKGHFAENIKIIS